MYILLQNDRRRENAISGNDRFGVQVRRRRRGVCPKTGSMSAALGNWAPIIRIRRSVTRTRGPYNNNTVYTHTHIIVRECIL